MSNSAKLTPEIDNQCRADDERNRKIYKADELVQKARFSLSITEQRLILYAISKIEPHDDSETLYKISLNDFARVCGTEAHDSYNHVKGCLKQLADKSWWLNHGISESLVRWFSVVRISQNSGKIFVKFHEDMFPYLFELAKQMRESGKTYTSYDFRYVLPMKSTYSIRLYELLKSYQKNNQQWWFALDKLRHLLDCEHYERFPDFRRYALEPALKEINKFTDLNISINLVKDGRKVVAIEFNMHEKSFDELLQANHNGLTALDGKIHYWDSAESSK